MKQIKVPPRRSERKRMEDMLSKSAAEWTYAMDFIEDATYLIDLNDRLIRANHAFYLLTGLTPELAIGKDIRSLMHPEGEPVPCPVCAARAERRDASIIMEPDHPDNPTGHPIEVTVRIIRNGAAEPTGVLMGIRDLTRTRQSEAKLQLAYKMAESTAESIVAADADHTILWVNPAFTTITGYSPEEVLGKKTPILKSGYHSPEFYAEINETMARDGHWQGEVMNRRKDGSLYPAWLNITEIRNGKGAVTHYVAILSDISQHKQDEEKILFLATHDVLTQLPNRTLFSERLESSIARAKREHRRLALLFIDLDLFKRINDTLGHAAGDSLLQAVAARLQDCLREMDSIARFGGDEFVALLDDIGSQEEAMATAQRIIGILSEPFENIEGHELVITPSIGISIYPNDGADAQTLIKHSDVAMYQAKSGGRNTYRFFSPEMNAKGLEYLLLEKHLRHALERNELLLYYQPQIDLASRRVVGAEALLRWNHPELGMVSPIQFISLAEESGLILPIGEWVLRTACLQNKRWQEMGLQPLRMAVNLSAKQFHEKKLPEIIAGILDEAGLDPVYLDVELTESCIMSNAEETARMLGELKDIGIQISIDDFGTGYSSLSYLKRFPISAVKIDRSFVMDIPGDANDTAIARAVISLGHSLGLTVIAEGVETTEQLEFLASDQCDEAQGYYFAASMSAEEFTQYLKNNAQG